MKMKMKLTTLLEASEILFDKTYTLERVYSREDNLVKVVYTIKENHKKLLVTCIMGPYSSFEDLIDYINDNTITAFKNAISRNK